MRKRIFSITPLLVFALVSACTQPNLEQIFENPGEGSGGFGSPVALDADDVVVHGAGQVYLFDGISGAHLHTLDDPTPVGAGGFGGGVAIDGDSILVGEPASDADGDRVGEAHLFDATTGAPRRTLNDPTVTGRDGFGTAVAVHGSRLLIGAPGDDTYGTNFGQAHLFDADSGVLLRTFDDPTVGDGEGEFGQAVALDSDRVLVGEVGQAHLFDASTGALLWTFDAPAVTGVLAFGHSVALEGDRVLIGAPGYNNNVGQVRLFDATAGTLVRTFDDPTDPDPLRGHWFGSSVSLDEDRVLIGEPQTSLNELPLYEGQAHLFDASSGALIRTFNNPPVTGLPDQFGYSVALDSGRALIGAPGYENIITEQKGRAYLYGAE
jgi:outer membrane protein assembly factor BamB